jgi:hypothetical protein
MVGSAIFHLSCLLAIAILCASIVGIAWHVAQLGYLREMMLRVPDRPLASWMARAQVAFVLAILPGLPLARILMSLELWPVAGIVLVALVVILGSYPALMLWTWFRLRDQFALALRMSSTMR